MDRRGGPSRGQDLFEESERQGRLHEEEKDVLKAIPVVLPMLPEHQGRESGIICGDWMVQVRPLIGDVAPMALCWWDDLMSEVMRRYQTWLQSDPLERLRMPSPQQGLYNFNATRKRLELRISTMLLAAMPPSLKEEVVASRQLTAGEIMYKVLRHYQPGGVQEKPKHSNRCRSCNLPRRPRKQWNPLDDGVDDSCVLWNFMLHYLTRLLWLKD